MGADSKATVMITDPPHYRAGDYECNDVQDALASTLWNGHPKVIRMGNALKYLWRSCSKGDYAEQVRKAAFELLSCIDEGWRMRVPPGSLGPNFWDKPVEPQGDWGAATPDVLRVDTIGNGKVSIDRTTFTDGTSIERTRYPKRWRTADDNISEALRKHTETV